MLPVVGQAAMPAIKVTSHRCRLIFIERPLRFVREDFLKNSDLMFKQSVSSTLLAASLASKFLKDNGLLTLAGAAAALDATPGSLERKTPTVRYDLRSFRHDWLWSSEGGNDSHRPKSSSTGQWHAQGCIRSHDCTVGSPSSLSLSLSNRKSVHTGDLSPSRSESHWTLQ